MEVYPAAIKRAISLMVSALGHINKGSKPAALVDLQSAQAQLTAIIDLLTPACKQ